MWLPWLATRMNERGTHWKKAARSSARCGPALSTCMSLPKSATFWLGVPDRHQLAGAANRLMAG